MKLLFTAVLALAVVTARADEEQDQFAVLHSGASISQKWKACQKLRVIGTVKTVPEVAALLTDPQLSQAARQTLDGLPYPEVDAVLHDALGKTSGAIKAGIIDSIGWRGKAAAVPSLIPLLSDSDPTVAAAAATSLGRLGGKKAVSALLAARDKAPESVQAAILAGLLQSAGHLDKAAAAAVYHKLYVHTYPVGIRMAAWRGLVLTDTAHQAELMAAALEGSDDALEKVALVVLREANNPQLVQGCAKQWDSLSAKSKMAVINAEAKLGSEGLDLVRKASQSSDASIRTAAWKAMGDLNDAASIPALAQGAASAKGAERQAARESLARLRGAGVSDALLAELKQSASPEKVEILWALGARQDKTAAKVLLENAASGDEAARLAALESLREIAPPEALAPLLDIAAGTDSDDVRAQAMEALSAVCQAVPDKDAATRAVVEAGNRLPVAQQGAFLPLLAELGTADGLAAAQSASQSQNLDVAKAAVRALAQWPNASPAAGLMDLAKTASDAALRTLALRGAIAVSAFEPDTAKRLALLKDALATANQPAEKKEALGQLGQIPTSESLDLALTALDDANVSHEAALAVLDIAEKLAPANPDLARTAAGKVLQQNKEGEIFQRAFALQLKRHGGAPFIRDWVVCGPYYRKGVVGAIAIFNVPLGPEIRDQAVDWKPVASADSIDLAGLFPGAENCAAYLRTTLDVPDDCSAVLLMGSDDGVKAWLNGAVVHSNNVDRPQKADQDVAPVTLKKGVNELVLKISQGGGGWGACARIVGTDANPIAGLRIERPTGAAGELTGTQ